jgi:hypothetical protein
MSKILLNFLGCRFDRSVVVGVKLYQREGALDARFGLQFFQNGPTLRKVACTDDDMIVWGGGRDVNRRVQANTIRCAYTSN